jgi:membrane protein YdbS with pleckstrin-like domain
MNEIENKEQKPKLCRLAILSPLLAIFSCSSALFAVVFPDFLEKAFMPAWILLLMFVFFIISSILVGVLALYKIHKSNGQLRGNFVALLGIVVALFLIFLSFFLVVSVYVIKKKVV